MKLQHEKTVTRKSLPLTTRDLRDIELLTGSLAHRTALSALADVDLVGGGGEVVSEAQLLHAIMEVGLRVVAERVEEESYEADAAERQAEDESRQSSARRRRPEWASES